MAFAFAKKLSGDRGSRRLLFVAFGVILFIAAVYIFRAQVPQVSSSVVPSLPNQGPTVQGGNSLSPNYRKVLNESDNQRAAEAKELGTSSVPTIVLQPQTAQQPPESDRSGPRLPPSDPPRQEPVVNVRPLNVTPPPPPPPPAVRPVTEMQMQNLTKGFGAMQDERLAGAQVQYWNDGKEKVVDVGDGSRQLAQIVSANAGSQMADPLKPFPGTILYAEMMSEANSDAPGPILAKIQQGPLAGTTVIGSFKSTGNTATPALVIEFKRMTIIKNEGGRQVAKTVDIDSYAVDTDKLGTALATDVDRHLFEKISIAAAQQFTQSIGQVIQQSGSTVTRDQTGTTISNPTLDTKQQLIVAGAQAGSAAGSILFKEFGNTPTTIKVRQGTPIGILFL